MKNFFQKSEISSLSISLGIILLCSFSFSPPLKASSQEEMLSPQTLSDEDWKNIKKIASEKIIFTFKEVSGEFFPPSEYLPDEKNSQGVQFPRAIRAKGETDRERTKYFIEHHCSAAVQQHWEYGYDFAEANGIKGALLFAIAFSDTGCGRALTSKNNIGNVGNSGNGTTKDYPSIEAGMEAIVYSLNGRYISGIEKVGHLSQGGRNEIGSVYECRGAPSPYKCYAMSTENWNANVRRALTSMMGQEADGNFVFRKTEESSPEEDALAVAKK